MKKHAGILLVCITGILCVFLLSNTYKNRNKVNDMIHVIGLGKKDFKSDLVIWSGNFEKRSATLEQASALLNTEKEAIQKYLV